MERLSSARTPRESQPPAFGEEIAADSHRPDYPLCFFVQTDLMHLTTMRQSVSFNRGGPKIEAAALDGRSPAYIAT